MNKPKKHHLCSTAVATQFLRLHAPLMACTLVLAACGGASEQSGAPPGNPSPAVGSATVSWVAPQTNADDTELHDLAGHRIYYGTTSGSYAQSVTISNPSATSHTIQNLPAATYYFVVRAFDTSDLESAPSPEVSKTIR